MTNFHINKKALENSAGIFRRDRGGQISFKMSQEPITIKKKPYQEVGHGTQEYDWTNMRYTYNVLLTSGISVF